MTCSKCNKHISHLFSDFQRDPEKLARRRDEKRARSHVLKEKILKMIESGLQLSEYQSRKAFSVYLHCILQRLTDFDPDAGQGSNQQVRTRRSIHTQYSNLLKLSSKSDGFAILLLHTIG